MKIINIIVLKAKISFIFIFLLQADVIVNSVDSDLDLSKGRGSKVLSESGGQSIQQECLKNYPSGISENEVAVTNGGNLKCRKIYHVHLPKWEDNNSQVINMIVEKNFSIILFIFNSSFSKFLIVNYVSWAIMVVIVIVWQLDLQLPVQLVPITTQGTKVVSSNPAHDEVYSIQHYVIKFISDL